MKGIGATLFVALFAAATAAWPNRGFHHEHGFGHERHWHPHGAIIYLGPSLAWPGYRPFDDPFYAPPRPIIVQPPPMYIERGSAMPDPATADPRFWYYCEAATAYYPYVKECPGGWRAVVPQPAQ